jgi:hypothetical protein
MIVSRESSPCTENSSPFGDKPSPKISPRAFWSSRETMSPSRFDENSPDRSPSPSLSSPKRRTSIERLKQASRVKNSNIFALENKDSYDPTSLPIVERPTANRPLSSQLANNTFHRYDSLRKENNPIRSPQRPGHKRSETEVYAPTLNTLAALTPSKSASLVSLPPSPEKNGSPSPTKSSMARTSMFGASSPNAFSPETTMRSDTPRALHRHNKSVTFHADPPVVNEYEEQTPEPSVSVDSREGSWDSEDFEDQDISFDRGSSADLSHHEGDDSFDEDLENTDKTPVVLPEDWSRMSPDEARTDLVSQEDDVFDGSPSSQRVPSDSRPLPPLPGLKADRKSGHRHSMSKEDILNMRRRLSLNQEEERPGSKDSQETAHGMPEELTITNIDTGEKMDVHVNVAEAPLGDDSVVEDLEDLASAPRISRESILRNVRNSRYDVDEDDEDDRSAFDDSPARPSYAEMALMDPDQPIPSRENSRENSQTYLGPPPEVNELDNDEVAVKDEPIDDANIDLNAIPAIADAQLEAPRSPSRMDDDGRQSSVLHHLQHRMRSESEDLEDSASQYSEVEPEAESTVLHNGEPEVDDGKETLQDAMQLLTVKDYSEPHAAAPSPAKKTSGSFMGLPSYFSTDDYDFGINKYIAPSPPASNDNTKKLALNTAPVLQPAAEIVARNEALQEPYDGVHREISPPGTPDSVVHNRESEVSSMHSYEQYEMEHEPEPEPVLPEIPDIPDIPERRSTIKTGGKLKARPSSTPADMQAMAEQRRIVSQEHPVPAIPDAFCAEFGIVDGDAAADEHSTYSSEGAESAKADSLVDEHFHRPGSRQLKIDIPLSAAESEDLSTGLDKEFERVIESQKVGQFSYTASDTSNPEHRVLCSDRPFASAEAAAGHTPYSPHQFSAGANPYRRTQKGYLMRQNTKVVVASNRNFSNDSNGTVSSKGSGAPPISPTSERPPRAARSANSSPRKPSAEQFLKTEPWNGKIRRKSVRNASAQRPYLREAAPPLPGHESALGVVDEDFVAGTGSLEDEVAEGTERGRLFVKVVGVKDLELPLPRNDRLYFQLTLDNGLHCVTTSSLELGRTAPIGQEFELVVLNDLEFQLTLTTQLPPPPKAPATPRPSTPRGHTKSSSKSGFSRFLSSPKKRAEKERQEREAAEAEERRLQEEAQRKRASVQPTAWDLLHELVNAQDGSFARAYINLKSHEKQCFGRQLTVDVPCYNEWALEKDSHVVNSVRSKRGANAGPIRRPPYVVGKLELQLLYVPKPRGATDEEMPKSMGGAIREMAKAGEIVEVVHEGHLSQQGGDCAVSSSLPTFSFGLLLTLAQHWRRRFFRLQGSRLTAYHEHTHQKRAIINLSKASRLVDDKTTLVADPTSQSGKSRRKSAFAEEDEGYQYVEEGFRIRFANGETIDFYADSRAEKDRWMMALSQVIGKPSLEKKAATWTDLVLAREKAKGRGPATLDGSSSPIKDIQSPAGTEIRDFTKPPPSARRPIPSKDASKSTPTSPAKPPPSQRPPPLPPMSPARAKTPPLAPRSGHRSRDAVKSMIF